MVNYRVMLWLIVYILIFLIVNFPTIIYNHRIMFRAIFDKFLFKILPSKRFELGEGCVTRYTLIEIKWLFSIYFHHIETLTQDRFHTHAFNAHVFIIRGGYTDEIKSGIGANKPTKIVEFGKCYRFIPRELNHRLLKAKPGTISLLFTGPYSTIWTEEIDDGTLRILTTHRIPLYEGKMTD